MAKRRVSPIEQSLKERAERERKRCEIAILNRLYASPATIEELDSAAGFPKKLINAVVNDLLHQGRIASQGFTYFYNHLHSILETQHEKAGFMRKKKKTQDLPNKDLRHTSLPFYQLDRETFWMMIDAGLLSAPSALYFYTTLNCDLDTGQGHRIEYDEVAELLGFNAKHHFSTPPTFSRKLDLLIRADSGGFTPKIPRVKHQQQIVKRQREVKRERNFYVELDKRIVAVMDRIQ